MRSPPTALITPHPHAVTAGVSGVLGRLGARQNAPSKPIRSGAVRYAITSIELWTLRVRDCLRAKHVDVVPNSWPSNVGPSGKKMAGSRGFQASGFAPPILDTR
jgi:hypothetical protein